MKKNLLFFLLNAFIIILITSGCGDAPLTNAQDFIPNRAPVISDLGSNLPEGAVDYLVPGMVIDITLSAADPENEALNIEFSSDYGSFRNQATADGITTIEFIIGENILGDVSVTITVDITDASGARSTRTHNLGTGKSGPTISETGTPNRYTRPYSGDVADERTFIFTSDSDGIYQIQVNQSEEDIAFNKDEAVYLYYVNEADTIEVIVNEVTAVPAVKLDSEGKYIVHVIFKDFLDQTQQFSKVIIVDGSPPDAGSITCPKEFTNIATTDLTISANCDPETESPITHMWFSNDDSVFSNLDDAVWEPYTTTRANWAIDGSVDGEKTIFALFKDQAGNTTTAVTPITGSITLDRLAPTGSIDIIPDRTNSSGIVITPDGDPDLSGITDVAFSDSSTGPWNWVAMPVAGSNVIYILPSLTEGTKTVYAAYRDMAGNISANQISDTVEVDLTPPAEVKGLTADPFNHRIELSWSNPGDMDLAQIIICRETGKLPTTITKTNIIKTITNKDSSHSDNSISLINGSSYGYLIVTQDSVGNRSSGSQIMATPINHAPNIPVEFKIAAQASDQFTLSWNHATPLDLDNDEVTYQISANSDGGEKYTIIENTIPSTKTSFTIFKNELLEKIGNSAIYYITISAIDSENLFSGHSDQLEYLLVYETAFYTDTDINFKKVSADTNTAFVIDSTSGNLLNFDITDKSSITANTKLNAPGFKVDFATATIDTMTILSGTTGLTSNNINVYAYNQLNGMDNPDLITFGTSSSLATSLAVESTFLLIGANDGFYTKNKAGEVVKLNLGGLKAFYNITGIVYDTNLYLACHGMIEDSKYYNNGIYIIEPEEPGPFGETGFNTPYLVRPSKLASFRAMGIAAADGFIYVVGTADGEGTSGFYVLGSKGTDIGSYQHKDMQSPQGVAVINEYAFVAAGSSGMAIIDISTPETPSLYSFINNHEAWDFAVVENYLVVAAGSNGLRVYLVPEP